MSESKAGELAGPTSDSDAPSRAQASARTRLLRTRSTEARRRDSVEGDDGPEGKIKKAVGEPPGLRRSLSKADSDPESSDEEEGKRRRGGKSEVEVPLVGRKGDKQKQRQPNQGSKDQDEDEGTASKPHRHVDRTVMDAVLELAQGGPSLKILVVKAAGIMLVTGAILAVQVLCVFDKICFAPYLGDPAIPRGAGNMVIPVSLVTILVVAPFAFESISRHAGTKTVLSTLFITGVMAFFFLVGFSRAFSSSRKTLLLLEAEEEWNSYSVAVQHYYGDPASLAHERRVNYVHIAVFGMAGFIACGLVTAACLHTLAEPIFACLAMVMERRW